MEFEISLNSVRLYGFHGVFPEERKNGNEFIFDVNVKLPYNPDIKRDELEMTVSYAELFEIVKEENNCACKLLEVLALNISKSIKEKYPELIGGFIRIEKVRPPIAGMIGTASVKLNF